MAEILITLGIIGVVAVLTMPSLVQQHRNQVVETRLKKAYSSINQAIIYAELDYGERESWFNYDDIDTDKNGNKVKGDSPSEKWMNKYFVPYLNSVKSGTYKDYPVIYFADGSALMPNYTDRIHDWMFFAGKPDKCGAGAIDAYAYRGKCSFSFNYNPLSGYTEIEDSESWKHAVSRNFEPYKYQWDGTLAGLYDGGSKGCNQEKNQSSYCTALIQYNGWKIPKNYPFKVTY